MKKTAPRFGTDGIRGLANEELTPSIAMALGAAAAAVFGRHSNERHIIVGRDTRLSGEMLESALDAGLASMGAHVISLGVIPTPGVARLVQKTGAIAGAVVSASHNPYADNGIKFFGPDSKKLSDEVEEEIEAAIDAWQGIPRPVNENIGRIQYNPELIKEYTQIIEHGQNVSPGGMKVVIDCANGATSYIAPELFMRLGAEVTAINVSPNGVNINLKCGSTHPAAMSECVQKVGADAGLAFDGDGDRVMMCDEKGQIVDGDRMMAICAIAMKKRSELKNNIVVATIMSNAGLEIALENEGIILRRTDVGDRYVAEEMVRSDAVIGGEQSGHLLLPKRTPTGDGMITGLAVLAEMKEAGKPLSALASVIHTYPQLLRNVRVKDRNAWKSNPEIQEAIENAKHRLSRPEWLSVRASGTEPLVRVMAQDTDRTRVEEIVFGLCDLIESRS